MKIFVRSMAIAAALSAAGIATDACAQSRGGSTAGSSMGATGGIGGTSSGIGSNTSGIGGGTGTTGSTGSGNSSTSRTGSATSPTNQTTGTEAISRSGDRTMTDVGTNTAAGGAGGLGALGGLGGLGGGGFGGLGGLSPFGLNPFGTGAGSSQKKSTIRTRLRSEVVVPNRTPVASSAVAQQRVGATLSRPRFQGVGLSVSESGAVLTGSVRSEADRRMAELLLRLEPGVGQIDNQITVAP